MFTKNSSDTFLSTVQGFISNVQILLFAVSLKDIVHLKTCKHKTLLKKDVGFFFY